MAKKEKPILSVIIPARNESTLLPKCLSALLKQSINKPYEIIVVDNNSTDDIGLVAGIKRVRVIKEFKPGPAAARNTGAKAAQSNLLVFIDADCFVPYNHLEKILNLFKNARIDAVAGHYIYRDAPPFIEKIINYKFYYPAYYTLVRKIFGVQIILGGNFAITKKAFAAAGGFNEAIGDIYHSEDTEFAVKLKNRGFTTQFFLNIPVSTSSRRIKPYIFYDHMLRNGTHWRHLASYRFPFLFKKSMHPLYCH